MVIWGILVLSLGSKFVSTFMLFLLLMTFFFTFSDVDHIILFVDLSLLWGQRMRVMDAIHLGPKILSLLVLKLLN
jgi:hypothetical protein